MKLVIAEKPMLARDIARAICGTPVPESAPLPISGNGYTVIACSGHLLELVEPEAVNPAWADRYDLDLLPISIPDWPKEPAVVRDKETGEVIDSKEPLIDKIAVLLPQADCVIHAGDPDDEGQLIVDEVLDYLGYEGEVLRVYVNDNIAKTVPANDKLGALPYDTYTVEELRCAANEGFVLVKIEGITVKRDSVTVDLGTIDDSLQTEAYIHTSARDGMDGDKLILPDEQAVVTDHVEFTGLVPGKAYTMRATLVDQKTGDVIGGPVEKGFTPAGQSGSVEMEITVDLLGYAGKKVVVFEELTCDGSTVCEHKDLDDTEQTLRVLKPSIGTTAKDGIDGDQQAVIDPEAVIVDTVSYKNLVPGREYTVKGQLMVKSTGEPLKDKDGKPVTAEAKFTPADTTGTVDLDFTFDGSALKGESVVAFETLYRGDKELAAHADIDDEGQTVEFTKPSIGTTAKDGVDGDQHSATDPEAVIVDTVSYKNLVPGREYTVKGKLMLKSTGDPLLNENGKEYTAETKFTPDGTYGTVDVTFTFDATDLDGESVVVFETLYRGGTKICAHADIDDEGQTVEFAKPSIGTTAKDGIDGDQQAVIDPEAVIVDTVAYTGLIPGKEYTVKGKLMDKETGEALKVDGKAVTAEATFTPDHPSGTVDVTFEFDASALAGKKVVAFETLYRLGKKVCAHADIDDEGQTVEFTKPPKGGVYDKTGNMLSGYGWVAALLVVAAVAGAGYAGKQYLDARKEKDGDADGGES